jgi:hypothetical protein
VFLLFCVLFAQSEQFADQFLTSVTSLCAFAGQNDKTQEVARTMLLSLLKSLTGAEYTTEKSVTEARGVSPRKVAGTDFSANENVFGQSFMSKTTPWHNAYALCMLVRRFIFETPWWSSSTAPTTPNTPAGSSTPSHALSPPSVLASSRRRDSKPFNASPFCLAQASVELAKDAKEAAQSAPEPPTYVLDAVGSGYVPKHRPQQSRAASPTPRAGGGGGAVADASGALSPTPAPATGDAAKPAPSPLAAALAKFRKSLTNLFAFDPDRYNNLQFTQLKSGVGGADFATTALTSPRTAGAPNVTSPSSASASASSASASASAATSSPAPPPALPPALVMPVEGGSASVVLVAEYHKYGLHFSESFVGGVIKVRAYADQCLVWQTIGFLRALRLNVINPLQAPTMSKEEKVCWITWLLLCGYCVAYTLFVCVGLPHGDVRAVLVLDGLFASVQVPAVPRLLFGRHKSAAV